MKFVQFPESNKVLRRPTDVTEKECTPLPIFTDGAQCISCWELSETEVLQIMGTKRIWLQLWSGQTQPPVNLTIHNPFEGGTSK